MRVLHKALAKVREMAVKKRVAASTIRHQLLPVRAGLWLIGSEFSRHSRVGSLPEPLSSAKQPGGWPASRYYAPLMRVAAWISPPWFSVFRGTASNVAADVVLVNKAHEPVGFDLVRRLVLRRGTQAEVAQRSARHAKLHQTYRCASVSFDQNLGLMVEPLVPGRGLAVCTGEDRATCIAQIFAQLAAAPVAPVPAETVSRWGELAGQTAPLLDLPETVRTDVARRVSDLIGRAKRCWIHGDLSGDNIVVQDRAFTVIDLDTVVAGPAFADIMTLSFAEARLRRCDFLDRLLTGMYDDQLMALGCDISPGERDASYTALFVAWLAWCRVSGDFPEKDLGRFIALWTQHHGDSALAQLR